MSDSPPPPSSLQQLVWLFRDALKALGVQPSPQQLEEWSVLVHESMSSHGRRFHTVGHVFDISRGAAPIQSLAILFHDTVYWQVDGGLAGRQHARLADVVEERADGSFALSEFDPRVHPRRALTAKVFGFSAGQALSLYGGLNEFLSALLGVRALEAVLDRRHLAEVAACIEATIPFRDPGASGEEPSLALAQRLEEANQEFALGMSPADIEQAVHQAVDVANRDVGNFAALDPTFFLDNTWKLLPETNHSLRGQRLYTVGEYRLAIQKMAGFLGHLDTVRVFRAYQGRPAAPELEQMRKRAEENVSLGSRYLRAKLLAAVLLEALAEVTGGDAPIAMFMGDLPAEGRCQRLEDFLPAPPRTASDASSQVLELLSTGRSGKSDFDLKTSPLAAHLYQSLGAAVLTDTLQSLPAERGSGWARAFLDLLPNDVVAGVARACARIAVARETLLEALASD